MDAIPELLRREFAGCPRPLRACVAFSGGLDSAVLLHALAALRVADPGLRLRAVHVDHRLQAASGHWAAHCEAVCASWQVPVEVLAVQVPLDRGDGLEAAARDARYAALRDQLAAGEYLLTAHHREDQAETVLLALLRGSGAAGLAGIAADRPFGPGRLRRPLLPVARHEIAAYARAHGLAWIDDPHNLDPARDRNYLRHQLLPLLLGRWPGAAGALTRTARLQAETQQLLAELAHLDARMAGWDGRRLETAALRTLGEARARNLVRELLRERGIVPPPERRLRTGLAQLLCAPADRAPALDWPGGRLCRYRGALHLLPPDTAGRVTPTVMRWAGDGPLELGPVAGRLRLAEGGPDGLTTRLRELPLEVRFRQGGERIRLPGRRHHTTLKDLFQAAGIVPWMRTHVPLVYAGGRLAAVADLWLADEFRAVPGQPALRIVWSAHEPLR